jgi:tetratricopeptide (TPR) repeat protein
MTEYAPPNLEVAQGPSVTQLPGLLVLLGTLGLALVAWRRSPATTFGIGWLVLVLLPASNFLVPAGFIIAERTLLAPSIGAMIALGSAVPAIYARIEHSATLRRSAAAAVAVLLALGVWRSDQRDRAWHDNETLFRQGIKDSPDSYRAHFMLGVFLFESRRLVEGERHYREALRLFPYDPLMAYALAEQYRAAGLCVPAIPLYRALYSTIPDARMGHLGFASCLLQTFQLNEARRQALAGIQAGAPLETARAISAAAAHARDSIDARAARGDSAARAIQANLRARRP